MGINLLYPSVDLIISHSLLKLWGDPGSENQQLMPTNQEFDTGNICVENWLTICNNLLMDHQQHYWYIKNSCRALQNTNNSICVLYTTCDWLAAVSLSHWTTKVTWPECSPLIGRHCRHSFPWPGCCRHVKLNGSLWETCEPGRRIFITTQFQWKWGEKTRAGARCYELLSSIEKAPLRWILIGNKYDDSGVMRSHHEPWWIIEIKSREICLVLHW